MISAVGSRALQRLFGLDKPETRHVSVRRSVAVPMDDGVILLADHYAPRPLTLGASAPPVILVRSPYGRGGVFAALYGRVLAERGFQVFLQSCRGTADSGGEFVPQTNEQRDGIATVRWLRAQPWCEGTIASTGMSYLGYTQYATATHPEADIAALALQVTMADLGEPTFSHGGFSLANTLTWVRTMSSASSVSSRVLAALRREDAVQDAADALPLVSTDRLAAGRSVSWFQDWLANPSPDLPYWREHSHRDKIPELTAPVSMLTGWYDLFLPWMLRDYATLAAADNPPELTIGPWRHGSSGHARAIPGTTIRFLRERVLGAQTQRPAPVRLFVTGKGGGWRDLPSWPPVAQGITWHLDGDRLARDAANGRPGRSSSLRYDPANPTPAVGGPLLASRPAVVDNSDHESRSDVLTWTSPPLQQVLEVAGIPTVEVVVSSDNPHHDVFVRLCDVDAKGRSWNVSDRLTRLDAVPVGEDGLRTVCLELWPCWHRFSAGHRLRLQVSGGAHPRYARNLGTGEAIATGTKMRPVTIAVHHAGSRMVLPTTSTTS